MDLITCDERGQPWHFNCKHMGNAAIRDVLQDKPLFLIASPMCGPFGAMDVINYARVTEEEENQKIDYGRKQLEFCIRLYVLQWREGRYFPHGHPEVASPRKEACVVNMLKRQGVVRVNGDQCRYGLTSHDGYRKGPARKLSLTCPNARHQKANDGVIFINGRAKAVQFIPQHYAAQCALDSSNRLR